ncbi:g4673 [Coccomyxa elongata]
MALRVNTTGNVLLRNVGRDGAEAVDTTASVAVKRKFGETTYSLRATESTIKNIRALNGALVQMSKPLGNNFTGNLKWDLGGKNFTLGIFKSIKLAQGRLVELGTSYAEKNGIFSLEAAMKPHKDHRLTATCIPQTNTVFGAYSIAHRGFTLTPAHNFAKKATVLTLSKKLSGGQLLKGSYSLKDKAAALELGIAPLTLSLRTKLDKDNRPTKPTLGLTINRDVEYRQVQSAAKPAAKDSVPAAQMQLSPTKDTTLDEKLKALDILYERQFAEKGQKKNGVEVATFTRK